MAVGRRVRAAAGVSHGTTGTVINPALLVRHWWGCNCWKYATR